MRRFRLPFPIVNRPLVIVALAAAGLAAACRSGPDPDPDPDPAPVSADTWAVVDGRAITRSDVDRAFQRLGDGSERSEEETLTAKLSLLEDLIVQDLLLARARELNVDVSATEIDEAFAQARADMPDDAVQQELTRRGLTEDDMREGLRRELLARKVLEQEVSSKVTVADQEVTDFFDANRERFNLPEDSYHLGQIIVTPVADAQLANRTGDDATTPDAAKAKVAMLMERLKAGTPFSQLAMDFSEDPESAVRGGDVGLVPLSAIKQAPPALRDAALNAPPGTARVVSQEGSYTIVYVVAREPAGQRDLSTPGVREQIRDTVTARKEQLLRTAYLTQIRSDADVTNHLARRLVESQGRLPATAGG